MRISLRYYTSCGGQAYTTGEPPYTMETGNTIVLPCNRNDKVWINPPTSSVLGSIAGTNALGNCNIFPGGWINPETHSVMIYDITGGGSTPLNNNAPYLVSNIGVKVIAALQVGKKYRFEYRNRRATFPPFPDGNQTCVTFNPTIEVWQF